MLTPRKPSALLLETLVICILAIPFLQGRGKLDVIHLKNGDTITGEIKRLERGILTVSTDFMGTIGIEWRGVLRLTSPQTFDVDTGAGVRFGVVFTESGQDGVIKVSRTAQDVQTLERIDIVGIRSLDKNFWDRSEYRVDFGFDVTRANRNSTLNLISEVNYQTEKATTKATYSSFFTRQQELDTQTRNDLVVTHARRFRERWFGVGLVQYQQNEELGLEFRSLAGGGLGRYLKQSNHWILKATGGMALGRERFRDTEGQVNVEGMGALSLDFFRFEGNERDISTQVVFWPNFSDFGRIRIDVTSGIRYEIFKNLSLGFSLWNNYDSRPANENAEKNDFGLVSTIGYKFW